MIGRQGEKRELIGINKDYAPIIMKISEKENITIRQCYNYLIGYALLAYEQGFNVIKAIKEAAGVE